MPIAIDDCLENEATRVKDRALDLFKVRLEGAGGLTKENMAAQRRWIRSRLQQRADSCAPTTRQVHEAMHPFDQAVFSAGKWEGVWNKPHPADSFSSDCLEEELMQKRQHIGEFLNWIPREGYAFPALVFCPKRLRAIAAEGAAKAAGGDDWKPSDLAKLPMAWWECFARLWEVMTRCGVCPKRWTDIMVALLDKDDGSQRPLSIASALWRIGATSLVRQMAPWIERWGRTSKKIRHQRC